MPAWFKRLGELFGRNRVRDEMDEEFQFHLDMEVAKNVRAGMSPDEARRAATLAFGGQQRFRDETGDARGFIALENLVRDTRFALRRLRRSPAFSLGAIITLGLGLGAASGIGAVVNGVLLRDLPYEHPNRLVRVSFITPGIAGSDDKLSEAVYAHFAAASRSFETYSASYTNDGVTLTEGEGAERVKAAMVTPGAFDMLRQRPLLGQVFAPGDTAWVGSSPVLISQSLWEQKFGSDPSIIGRRIQLNLGAREVTGVLPSSFDFPAADVQVWYPTRVTFERPSITDRHLNVIARLQPGVNIEAAERELNTLIASLPSRFPVITAEALRTSAARVRLQTYKSSILAPVRSQLLLLATMVIVVLVVASTNVVNLFLLRAERAAVESAIALSLGATRVALVRRFMVEGLLLAVGSLAISLPIAAALVRSRLGFSAREMPRLHEVTFDVPTLVAIALVTLLVGAVVGLTTLVRTSAVTGDRLVHTASRSTSSRAWRSTQRGLVATQVALALSLVITAGLLGRSFWNLRRADLGFDPANATTFQVSLPFRNYLRYPQAAAFHGRVIDALSALPGVSGAVAASDMPLLESGSPDLMMRLEAVGGDGAITMQSRAVMATPPYFRVMGIPLVHGRSFAAGDLKGEPGVVLSERVASALFGTADPIGRLVRRMDNPSRPQVFRIVGVAREIPGARIEDGRTPRIWFPLLPDADGLPADSINVPMVPRSANYVIRSLQPLTATMLRSVVSRADAQVPAMAIQPVERLVDGAFARVRLTLVLLGLSGAAALLLGMVGVYSVVSYAAAAREREFGVRMALGAAPMGVARMVLREGGIMAVVGIAAGLVVAWAGTRFLGALLYEVSPLSVVEFAAGVLVIGTVTLVATLLPARRASRTDPALVLRGE